MSFLPNTPYLEFTSEYGIFTIRPVQSSLGLFALCIETKDEDLHELGRYCAINDAVLAVSRQESGHIPWDQTPSRELPFRVHDIACWKLSENNSKSEGTKMTACGSMAS